MKKAQDAQPVVETGSISSGGLDSFFGADSCSSSIFSFSLSFSRFPGFRSLMSRDKFLHRTSISNFKFSWKKKKKKSSTPAAARLWNTLQPGATQYLEVMFLMELSENIHNGHGPRILRPENLQQRRKTHRKSCKWTGFPPHILMKASLLVSSGSLTMLRRLDSKTLATKGTT